MAGTGGAHIAGAYKIRKNGERSYSVALPLHVGEMVYGLDRYYVAQLVDEGILLKPLDTLSPGAPIPEWAKK